MLLRQGFDPVPESLAGIPRRTDHQPGLRSRSYAPGRRVLAPQPLRRSRDSLAALHVAGLYSFRALRNHGKGVSKKRTTGAGQRTLQRAIAMDPNSYTAHHFLGQLYREMGRTDAAEREMKTAAQIQQLQAQNTGRNR